LRTAIKQYSSVKQFFPSLSSLCVLCVLAVRKKNDFDKEC
jgi:hypothetical protein